MTSDDIFSQIQSNNWVGRVQVGLLDLVTNVKIMPNPGDNGATPSTPTQIAEDKLGRQILLDQAGWAQKFALPCALGFKGAVDLSVAAVGDADIFSRLGAIYNEFVPST